MMSELTENPSQEQGTAPNQFWWQEDAWNQKTFDWFAADDLALFRIRGLYAAVWSLAGSTIPKILPSAEWLAKVTQSNQFSRIDDSLIFEKPGVPYSLCLARALAELSLGNTTQVRNEWQVDQEEYAGIARTLFSVFEFTEENFDLCLNQVPYGLRQQFAMHALLRNPSIPPLGVRGDLVERPFRTLINVALDVSSAEFGNSNVLERVLLSVYANEAATTEDIEYVMSYAKKNMSRVSSDRRWRFEDTVSLLALEVPPAVEHMKRDASEARVSLADPAMQIEAGVEEYYLDETIPRCGTRNSFNVRWRQPFAHQLLLHREASEITERLRDALRTVAASEGFFGGFDAPFNLASLVAPAIGKVYVDAATEVGVDPDAIPFEWLDPLL